MFSIVKVIVVATTMLGVGLYFTAPLAPVASYKFEREGTATNKTTPATAKPKAHVFQTLGGAPPPPVTTTTAPPSSGTPKPTSSPAGPTTPPAPTSTPFSPSAFISNDTLKTKIICTTLKCNLCKESITDFVAGGPRCETKSISEIKELDSACVSSSRSALGMFMVAACSGLVVLGLLFWGSPYIKYVAIAPSILGVVGVVLTMKISTSPCDSDLAAFKIKPEAGAYLGIVGVVMFAITGIFAFFQTAELTDQGPTIPDKPPTPMVSLNSAVSITPRIAEEKTNIE